MNKKNKLYAELSTKERIKLEFKEKSMIYKFYMWLIKPNKVKVRTESKGGVKNGN